MMPKSKHKHHRTNKSKESMKLKAALAPAQNAFSGRIIFDHLAKTAGQAVNAWLRQELGTGSITDNLIGSHRELIQGYGGNYSIISGHFEFDGGGLDPRYQYMTLMREPVSRCISWTFFLLTEIPDSVERQELVDGAKSLLAGDEPNKTFINSISNYYVNHFCSINGSSFDSDEQKLNSAIAAVQCYNVVGLHENMPAFLADVADFIGIPAPQSIARVNVSSARPSDDQIPPEVTARISDLNKLDLQMYNAVVAWKNAQPHRKHKSTKTSRWMKYEPVRDRVFNTASFSIGAVKLREGSAVFHGQLLTIDVDFLLIRNIHELEAGIHILDEHRRWAFGTNSTLLGKSYTGLVAGSHRVTYHLIADLPAGKYTIGLAFAEFLPEGDRQELAWYDVLCEFQVFYRIDQRFSGYNYLPTEMTLQPTTIDPKLVIAKPTGNIALISKLDSMQPNERRKVAVVVRNADSQVWLGDNFRPVNLSYHWCDLAGNPVLYDGLRTGVPERGIMPGNPVEMEMDLLAPPESGRYRLEISLVQECVGWFEDKGFESARCEVLVG